MFLHTLESSVDQVEQDLSLEALMLEEMDTSDSTTVFGKCNYAFVASVCLHVLLLKFLSL